MYHIKEAFLDRPETKNEAGTPAKRFPALSPIKESHDGSRI
jgi:hypothetical protein